MAKQPEQKNTWGMFLAVIVLAGIALTIFLAPAKLMEEAWRGEIRQMADWIGPKASEEMTKKTVAFIEPVIAGAMSAKNGAGGGEAGVYLSDRVNVVVYWLGVIAFRLYALVAWLLIGLPFMMAAFIDGYYIREIRKLSFVSQSPIRHKLGIHFAKLVTVILIAWLLLPLTMPILIAPAIFVFMAWSNWMWMSNLQKRI